MTVVGAEFPRISSRKRSWLLKGPPLGFERERGRRRQNVAEAVVIVVRLTKSALEPWLLPWHTADSRRLDLRLDDEIDRTDARLHGDRRDPHEQRRPVTDLASELPDIDTELVRAIVGGGGEYRCRRHCGERSANT
jgi:hypothetical protein